MRHETDNERSLPRRAVFGLAVAACAVLLSLMTVFVQVKTLGLSWHEAHYRARIDAVAARNADAPAQYRPLSDTALAGLYNAAEAWAAGMPEHALPGPLEVLRRRPVGTVFVVVRLLQNTVIFLIAFLYCRRLGVQPWIALLGLMALAWAMTHANQDSDLAVNTYTEVIAYLLAGLLIVTERPAWVVPVALVAALNRETSVFIPVMLFASTVRFSPTLKLSRPVVRYAAFAMGLYVGVFIGLRQYFGARGWAAHPSGAEPGLELLLHNLTRADTWGNLAGTLGLLPVIGLILWRAWPRRLKAFFWAIVPWWFPLHACFGVLAETRLVLVPLVMVFLPGALLAVQQWREAFPGAAAPREAEA